MEAGKNTLRMFVAIEVCDPIVERAQQLIAKLQAADAVVSWVKPQTMHITLKFGEAVLRAKQEKVLEVVAQTAAKHKPFSLRFAATGAFPRVQRPQILWVGIDDPSDGLAALHRELERGLAKLGFPKEARGYNPHLTLGRLRSPDANSMLALAKILHEQADFVAGEQMVRELVVFSSELTTSGPIYTALFRAELNSAL